MKLSLLWFLIMVFGMTGLGTGGCAPVHTDEKAHALLVEEVRDGPFEKGPIEVIPAAYHANRLLQGDFRCEKIFGLASGVNPMPFHLNMLMSFGELATPELLALLECEKATPLYYYGTLRFKLGLYQPPEWDDRQRHQATIADLADCALRDIYEVDVGFRSYLSKAAREKAIKEWGCFALEKGEYFRDLRGGKPAKWCCPSVN